MQIDLHSYVDTVLEAYIALILTLEYFLGRSDIDIKREEKRRQTKKSKDLDASPLSRRSGEKDMALEPGAPGNPKEG